MRILDKIIILVSNYLFILNLSISLLFIRRLYRVGLKGKINYKKLYFKYETKIVIKVRIINKLYLILYVVFKGEK